jgi:thioredoxin reductase (NADPH)
MVRGGSLAESMSDYLITQLNATANVEVRLKTRIVDARGEARLEGLTLEDVDTGRREEVAAAAVFVLIGSEPHTGWLEGVVRLGDPPFVLTGRDIPRGAWRLERPPLPFETSLPGVFAAGDVRYSSVKRVAGAVGEGSVSVGSVHQYLSELDADVASASPAPQTGQQRESWVSFRAIQGDHEIRNAIRRPVWRNVRVVSRLRRPAWGLR